MSDGSGLEALRGLLLGDPELAGRLARIESPEEFVAAGVALARREGIRLSADELARALRPDPLGIGRFTAAPIMLNRWPAPGWSPARSSAAGAVPAIDCIWFGPDRLPEPFYEDSVRRAWGRPLNLLMRSRLTLERLVADADAHDVPVPDGFILHMSRCGSTLLSQMLAQLPGHVLLSEPEPLDLALQWAAAADRPDAVAALRAMVKALARGRNAEGRRLFIKLDAWHTVALPLLREAFPQVPWMFLYREPLDVMASQIRMPGVHTVRGVLPDHVLGISADESTPQEEYCARALARICAAAIDHWTLGGGLLLNYCEFGAGVPPHAAAHFGIEPTDAEAALMSSAGLVHSKTGKPFTTDNVARHELAPAVVRAVDVHLRPLFEQLERLRRG